MPPLVSIIITNYNYGRFLGEAIESALAQTWQHKEVIVLDDESRDDSLDVACRYPITVIAQKNSGLSLEPLAKGALRGGFFAAGGKGGGCGRPFLA